MASTQDAKAKFQLLQKVYGILGDEERWVQQRGRFGALLCAAMLLAPGAATTAGRVSGLCEAPCVHACTYLHPPLAHAEAFATTTTRVRLPRCTLSVLFFVRRKVYDQTGSTDDDLLDAKFEDLVGLQSTWGTPPPRSARTLINALAEWNTGAMPRVEKHTQAHLERLCG